MRIEKIRSRNDVYQKFQVLKNNRNKRYKYHQFFVEGDRNQKEAYRNHWTIDAFLYAREEPLSDWAESMLKEVPVSCHYELSAELMRELSGKEDTSELLAIAEMRQDDFSQLPLQEKPMLALFDRPSNKGNLGTIIRSCDSLGVDGLILTGHGVDLYDPQVITSTMGSFFQVPVIRVSEHARLKSFIQQMKETYPDFQVIGTTSHHETPLDQLDLNRPLLFMIGNETDGLSYGLKETCDVLATIPMSDSASASSLNVGCAATVMFYEAARQRRWANNG